MTVDELNAHIESARLHNNTIGRIVLGTESFDELLAEFRVRADVWVDDARPDFILFKGIRIVSTACLSGPGVAP